ncbi:hypothetical protein AsAng_0026650 [Aureispira anguillae]|uniref:Uncharacterized protein n=2 Tax=Aureispira anguillae TaxID=2864201 RepID=A0A916DTM3_9BACT|nr:hypothetical protein [Aureispira anguillae]BDS11950.1 hypothetical protein AsAng_0026650 [Aureispira anguillae]
MMRRGCIILEYGTMRLGWGDGRVLILVILASLLLRGVDGLNLYQYARGNPVKLMDMEGYKAEPPPDDLVDRGESKGAKPEYLVDEGQFDGEVDGLALQGNQGKVNGNSAEDTLLKGTYEGESGYDTFVYSWGGNSVTPKQYLV